MAKEKENLKEINSSENEVLDFSDAQNSLVEEKKQENADNDIAVNLKDTQKKAKDNECQENNEIELSEEIAEEKLSEVMSTQKPKNRKKSTIISLILLLVNIVFMVFIIKGLIKNIGDQSFSEYVKTQGSRLWWLAGGLGCYILYMFSQTIMFHALIKSLTGKSKWGLSYNVGVTGKYYDNVTPFAVGGQPLQIVELAKTGISPGVSTSIPLMKMIINSMVSAILGLIFFIVGISRITPTNPLFAILFVIFEILGIIGLVITIFGVIFMIMLSTGNLFTRSLIAWIVKIGYKLKIVKNYRATLKKWLDQVSEYKSSMAYLMKNKKLLFKLILYSCLESLTYAGISFFVVMAFMDVDYMNAHNISAWFVLFTCVVKYYICSMAGSYIPLPGATGLMEIAFIALYAEYVREAIVWALLTWRIISYYLILVHGFIHELTKIIGNVSKSKRKRENAT